jgi:pimeloyl-ACP methyl ester carboxylesterase
MPDSTQKQHANALDKRQKRRHTPWVLRWLRFSFSVLNSVSPRWGARRAYRLWFTSPRFAEPAREQRWREQAQMVFVEHDCGPLAVYRWGQGPAVLLVHGWSGRGTQLGAFAAPLVKRGFSVVAFDAPGHGRSPGTDTNVFEVATALAAVAEQSGPLHAIIAHSFGTMATTLAIHQGLSVDKAVCISAPTSLQYLIERFCQRLGISPKTQKFLTQMLEQEFGNDIWQRIESDRHVADSTIAALIIHDKDDVDVPWQWSERLANAWPNSHFWLTRGMGHRRILRNRAVITAVCEFIENGLLPADSGTPDSAPYQPHTTPSSKSSIPS